jgi:signal transduction histidine kinase
MVNLLKLNNWSRFQNYTSIELSASERAVWKRNYLLSQLCMIAMLATVLHLLVDVITGVPTLMALDILIIFVLGATCWLNESGHSKAAKRYVSIGLNIILFIYANVIPKDNGIIFLYFPMISLYFVVFGYKEFIERYTLLGISVGILLLLELNNHQILGEEWHVEGVSHISYMLNLFTGIILTFFTYSFLIKSNHDAEQQLTQQANLILEQNKNLEKANKELDLFVYRSSHDMKAPVASIKGLLNLLQFEQISGPVAEYFDKIQNRVYKLERYINEITEYSRNVRMELSPEPLLLSGIFEEVVENHKYYKTADQVETIIEDLTKGTVVLDRARILNILNNLYYNALKYHNVNQPHPFIKIKAWHNESQVWIEVTDNGPGIDPSLHEKIFRMFYRGNEASDGSGLGLFIVLELVNKLGGQLYLESKPREGSSFKICLPLLPAAELA